MDINLENLPRLVSRIDEKLNLLLERSNKVQTETDRWFDLQELLNYDPEKRTKQTFYGYIHRKVIPFHKRGKKLIFLKSEIDMWLKEGRKKTLSEIKSEPNNFLKIRGKNS